MKDQETTDFGYEEIPINELGTNQFGQQEKPVLFWVARAARPSYGWMPVL